ncbi:hypothetical protein SDC9_153437 [bioreactor metagenome]|uniref:CRISPR-associated protein Cse2 n=1 Tax=bioreactor metagenome TaxID=1076179 RepID=A0A645EVX3_9ZZZZ
MNSEQAFSGFLDFLQCNRENPGIMADLRCALIPGREHRAWPHIARYFSLENMRECTIAATVAAAFALQPECGGEHENMGDIMRRIATGGESGNDGLNTFAARFQRLLACDSPDELSQQLHGIFKVAKRRGIALNHRNLAGDLTFWGDRVKRRWAEHYYSNLKKVADGEAEVHA